MNELNKLGQKINSINISNINSLSKLENTCLKFQNIYEEYNKSFTNKNRAIFKATSEELRKKLIDLSLFIYLKSYSSKTDEEFKKLFDLQKKLLEMFNKYFDNPKKIENYINYMKVILFFMFPKQTSLKKSELNIDNSFNIFELKGYNKGGINYFLYILKTELQNLKKKEDNFKILKEKSVVLIKLCEIFFNFNLVFLKEYSELLKECIKKFLENIYNIAKNMKNTDILYLLEIYNNVLSVYGSYFGYPNSNSYNKKNNVIWENLKELFDILKKLNKSEQNNRKERLGINNSVPKKETYAELIARLKKNHPEETEAELIARLIKNHKNVLNNYYNKQVKPIVNSVLLSNSKLPNA